MADCGTRNQSMNLSELSSGMDRDPDEQQHIVAEMTEIIKHDPSNALAYFRRGNAWSNLHDYAQAGHDLDTAIELEPGNAMAYNNRGIASLCSGDAAAAIVDLSGMLRRRPAHARQGSPRRPLLPSVRHDRLPQLGRGECGDALDRPMVGGIDIARQYGPLDAEGRHLGRRITHPCSFAWHP